MATPLAMIPPAPVYCTEKLHAKPFFVVGLPRLRRCPSKLRPSLVVPASAFFREFS